MYAGDGRPPLTAVAFRLGGGATTIRAFHVDVVPSPSGVTPYLFWRR